LEASDRAVRVAQRAARGAVGTLRIGFVESAITTGILGDVLLRFRRERPNVEIELSELPSLQQADAVQSRRMDVGFVHTRPVDLSDLTSDILVPGKFVVAVPRSSPLSKYARIPLDAFAQQRLVLGHRHLNPVLYDGIIACATSTGYEPEVAQHTIQFRTAASLAAAGLGLGIVPSSFATSRDPGVVYRSVQGLDLAINMELMWRQSDDSPVVRAFVDTVQSCRRYNVLALVPR
jgi:DNA-binding transcriptional LysR family regulator